MERLKRARHRSSGAIDEEGYNSDDLRSGRPISWNDSTEKRTEKHPLVGAENSDTHQATTSVQIHKQQSVRIHPFDSEPTTAENRDRILGEDHSTSRNIPTIPKVLVPEQTSRSESSIHPLDTDEPNNASITKVQESTRDTKHPAEFLQNNKTAAIDIPTKNPVPSREKAVAKSQTIDRPETGRQASNSNDNKVALSNRSATSSSSSKLSKPSSSQLQAIDPATLTLPITRETLRELDLIEIFKNPQLRHDIVFDPHLQFRPNFDGDRGIVKRREADRFWHEVGQELNNRRAVLTARRETTTTMLDLAGLSSSSPTSRLVQQQAQQMCPLPDAVLLPRLIDELREILLSLLPQNTSTAQDGTPTSNPEKALLISTLDPELLIQELDHGVLDVHTLFRFLGDSLKVHCAPMRDALVESMVTIVVDSDEIVRGIRMCFEILEWMKLDIANHQLRSLRPWLLDNSVDFEQKYFRDLLFRGGTIHRAEEWFKRSWINWDSVKRSVIGQLSSLENGSLPSPKSDSGLQRQVSPSSDGEQSGSDNKATAGSFNARRRPSIIRADIGENILDGVVNEGLLEMIMKPKSSVNSMPETFELDHYRILSFHNDFQDLTILCTLLILFRQLAQNCWTQQDLVEIKKVVWLLLTDENANFGANSSSGTGTATTGIGKSGSNPKSNVSGSQGMKDIVVQIEFAARKVRERSKNVNSTGRRSSLASESTQPTGVRGSAISTETPVDNNVVKQSSTSTVTTALAGSLSTSDTNLLTAWLDNALCKTSTLYTLIQKRLLIHFRRWLYVHSSSSMLVLSASCASLASAMSMSSSNSNSSLTKAGDDEDDDDKPANCASSDSQSNEDGSKSSNTSEPQPSNNGAAPTPVPGPELSHEEATKAAAEALAAKLSFNATEMEAHGLTGLEDEMIALLEKIRGVSEFNKKVYGSWYRDMVKQGRAENWLEHSNAD
ncbi:hypothetical protein BGZ76_004524 [Entomortierella beljakovae]|nr:hypothetical protein BGZ76_004524 [Entomortierella beljakovae]